MTTLNETKHPAEYLLSEGEFGYSRDNVTLAPNAAALPSGQVLGQITASGKYVPLAPTATDGSQTAAAILFYPKPISAVDSLQVVNSRDCQVADVALTYSAGITAPQKTAAIAALNARGIVVRTNTLLPVVNA